jgi:hypothetical protein
VLVDQGLHDLEVPTVEIRNYDGGFSVGQKLAELGHARVAFLGPMKLEAIADRLNGFRDAMLDAGVLFDRSLVVDMGGEGVTDWLNKRLEVAEDLILQSLALPKPANGNIRWLGRPGANRIPRHAAAWPQDPGRYKRRDVRRCRNVHPISRTSSGTTQAFME